MPVSTKSKHDFTSGCDIDNNKPNTVPMNGDDEQRLFCKQLSICNNTAVTAQLLKLIKYGVNMISTQYKTSGVNFCGAYLMFLFCLYAKILTAQSTHLSKLSCSAGLTILYTSKVYENVLLMLTVAWYSDSTVIIMHYIVKGTQLLL